MLMIFFFETFYQVYAWQYKIFTINFSLNNKETLLFLPLCALVVFS